MVLNITKEEAQTIADALCWINADPSWNCEESDVKNIESVLNRLGSYGIDITPIMR